MFIDKPLFLVVLVLSLVHDVSPSEQIALSSKKCFFAFMKRSPCFNGYGFVFEKKGNYKLDGCQFFKICLIDIELNFCYLVALMYRYIGTNSFNQK